MRRHLSLVLAAALLPLAACTHGMRNVPAPDEATRAALRAATDEVARSVSVNEFEAGSFGTLPYRLLRPRDLVPGKRYPLVVIFHGSGAIGTNNIDQIGPLAKSWATPKMRERYPAFVLVPHFSTRSAVYTGTTSLATNTLRDAMRAIDELQNTLPIDKRRIYAVGFSMGGSAVWNAILLRPGLFSAAVVVAGVPNRDALSVLGRTRLLLVHGDADEENPFSAALAVYESAPKDRVAFWRYHGLAHEFPPQLIDGSELAQWLFQDAVVHSSPSPAHD